MNRKRVTVATVGVLVLAFLLKTVPSYLLDLWASGDPGSGPLPLLDSVGQSVSLYFYIGSTITTLAPTGVGAAFGYMLAAEAADDLREALRTAGTVAVGTLGVVAAAAVVVAVVMDPFFVITLSTPATVVIVTYLGMVGGAGVERFALLGDGGPADEAADRSQVVDADAR